MTGFPAILNHLAAGRDLDADAMGEFLRAIADGTLSDVEIGAALGALRTKGESLSELVGAARMLRRCAVRIDCGCQTVVDVVGTGGDGANSFNISTTASFIAAGAGAVVAKHGNRSVSSRCGAADVLAELGFRLDVEPAVMEYAIQSHGIGFLFAAKLHPVMGKVAPLRKALKVRTIFNMLGPLINPAGANAQVLGVYAPSLVELYARALRELGTKRALVVHGLDGLDEISVCAPTRVAELKDGEVRLYELHPEMLTGTLYDAGELTGGEPAENARILRDILSGRERGAKRTVALVNAAAAIYVAGLAPTLKSGYEAAAESVDSGSALAKLEQLITDSQS